MILGLSRFDWNAFAIIVIAMLVLVLLFAVGRFLWTSKSQSLFNYLKRTSWWAMTIQLLCFCGFVHAVVPKPNIRHDPERCMLSVRTQEQSETEENSEPSTLESDAVAQDNCTGSGKIVYPDMTRYSSSVLLETNALMIASSGHSEDVIIRRFELLGTDLSFDFFFPSGNVSAVELIATTGLTAAARSDYLGSWSVPTRGTNLSLTVSHPIVNDYAINGFYLPVVRHDSDSDGLSDLKELFIGTNPNSSDTDGDGMKDNWEIQRRFDPNSDDSDLVGPKRSWYDTVCSYVYVSEGISEDSFDLYYREDIHLGAFYSVAFSNESQSVNLYVVITNHTSCATPDIRFVVPPRSPAAYAPLLAGNDYDICVGGGNFTFYYPSGLEFGLRYVSDPIFFRESRHTRYPVETSFKHIMAPDSVDCCACGHRHGRCFELETVPKDMGGTLTFDNAGAVQIISNDVFQVSGRTAIGGAHYSYYGFTLDLTNDISSVSIASHIPDCACGSGEPCYECHGTIGPWFEQVFDGKIGLSIDDDGQTNVVWGAGINPNAYYWVAVDVLAGEGDFSVDTYEETSLGSYKVYAKTGDRLFLPMLIGPEYKLSASGLEFVISSAHHDLYGDVIDRLEVNNWRGSVYIRWWVDVERVGGARTRSTTDADAQGFRITPDCLNGVWHWGEDFCCQIQVGPSVILMHCNGYCGCGGCTTGYTTYTYEGFTLDIGGFDCGCSPRDDSGSEEEDDDDSHGSLFPVTVDFSDRIVVFEDAYTNAPGDVVARRSSKTKLTLRANGGPLGGSVSFETVGFNRLTSLMGVGSVPSFVDLSPNENFEMEITFEGCEESAYENDIQVHGTYTENVTGFSWTAYARASVAKLTLEPIMTINYCFNRHRWGVYEQIGCRIMPKLPSVEAIFENGAIVTEQYDQNVVFECPEVEAEDLVWIMVGSRIIYQPETLVIRPQRILAENPVENIFNIPAGVPGGVGMTLDLYVEPRDVSFRYLTMREVPSLRSTIWGYFSDSAFSNVWYHTEDMQAGVWQNIGIDNSWFVDSADMGDSLTLPCSDGYLCWYIPIEWKRREGAETVAHRFDDTVTQEFEMSTSGCLRVTKYGYWVERLLDGSRRRSW